MDGAPLWFQILSIPAKTPAILLLSPERPCGPLACVTVVLAQPTGGHSNARSTCQGNARLSGRSQAASPPDDSFLVREQGDLPARAGIECVGRLRQAALRCHRGLRAARGRRGA